MAVRSGARNQSGAVFPTPSLALPAPHSRRDPVRAASHTRCGALRRVRSQRDRHGSMSNSRPAMPQRHLAQEEQRQRSDMRSQSSRRPPGRLPVSCRQLPPHRWCPSRQASRRERLPSFPLPRRPIATGHSCHDPTRKGAGVNLTHTTPSRVNRNLVHNPTWNVPTLAVGFIPPQRKPRISACSCQQADLSPDYRRHWRRYCEIASFCADTRGWCGC